MSLYERIEGPRPGGPWGYVVRRGGDALEVIVTRDAGLVYTPGVDGIWVRDALLHRRVEWRPDAEGVSPSCELVGGACVARGEVLASMKVLETHGRREGLGWEQPEAFWLELERLLERVLEVRRRWEALVGRW